MVSVVCNICSGSYLGEIAAVASAPALSLESIWEEKSPFSMLPCTNGASHHSDQRTSSSLNRLHALADHRAQMKTLVAAPPLNVQEILQTGARTVQEIEAEMRLPAQQVRQRQELERLQQLQIQRERDLRLVEQEQEETRRMHQLQQQEQLLRLGQHQPQQQSMPSPWMAHAHTQLPRTQSPRFHHQHQQQILMLQQEQERQQQERLRELQERLRMEELERNLRAQQSSQIQHQPSAQSRRQSSYVDLQLLQQRRTRSPAAFPGAGTGDLSVLNAQSPPQSIQLQKRLLSELAQAEYMRDVQAISQVEQEALRAEAMRKIMETERMEEKRRRKAAKIAHMVSPVVSSDRCLCVDRTTTVTLQ